MAIVAWQPNSGESIWPKFSKTWDGVPPPIGAGLYRRQVLIHLIKSLTGFLPSNNGILEAF